MAIATQGPTIADYVKELTSSDPERAVTIALAEVERQRAMATVAQQEYRAMAEVEFDAAGRITHANMGGLWRLAQMYAGSKVIPDHYQGKPNDCFIACQMSYRLGIDPLAYMQATHVIHGKPGMESKLAVALLNASGRIKGRVRYEEGGSNDDKSRWFVAIATDADTGEIVKSPKIDWKMVDGEGWSKKSGSKWLTMPDVMFGYRSAAFLIRRHYPEVLMGIQLADELEDAETTARIIEQSQPIRTIERLADSMLTDQGKNGNGSHEPTAESTAGEPSAEKKPDREPGDEDEPHVDGELPDLRGLAQENGCPANRLDGVLTAAESEKDPSAWIKSKPWSGSGGKQFEKGGA